MALSVGLPRLGVTQHHARWSSDFPLPCVWTAAARLPWPDISVPQPWQQVRRRMVGVVRLANVQLLGASGVSICIVVVFTECLLPGVPHTVQMWGLHRVWSTEFS